MFSTNSTVEAKLNLNISKQNQINITQRLENNTVLSKRERERESYFHLVFLGLQFIFLLLLLFLFSWFPQQIQGNREEIDNLQTIQIDMHTCENELIVLLRSKSCCLFLRPKSFFFDIFSVFLAQLKRELRRKLKNPSGAQFRRWWISSILMAVP